MTLPDVQLNYGNSNRSKRDETIQRLIIYWQVASLWDRKKSWLVIYFKSGLHWEARHAELKAGTNPPAQWLTVVAVKYWAPGTARRNKTSTDSDPICAHSLRKTRVLELAFCEVLLDCAGGQCCIWEIDGIFWQGTLVSQQLSWLWTLYWRWNPAVHCKATALLKMLCFHKFLQ